MPSTHRRRDETVELRRVVVGGVYMNSQLAHDDCQMPTDSAMWTQPSAVNQFRILQPML